MADGENNDLLSGLQQLAAGTFPRTCPTCGHIYQDFAQFLRETKPLERHSGLKEVTENDSTAVEVYRNCVCGSTLMDLARDRRDETEAGKEKRWEFAAMVNKLTQRGLARDVAHSELHKLIRGESSPAIEQLLRKK